MGGSGSFGPVLPLRSSVDPRCLVRFSKLPGHAGRPRNKTSLAADPERAEGQLRIPIRFAALPRGATVSLRVSSD